MTCREPELRFIEGGDGVPQDSKEAAGFEPIHQLVLSEVDECIQDFVGKVLGRSMSGPMAASILQI